MAESIAVDLIINTGQTAKTVAEIKQSIKDIKDAALQAGQGSKDFDKLATAARGLESKLQDVNKNINQLDPGKLGQQFARLGSSIAGGFQAAQGAMALFGNTGEDVQKALLKVQAATAFAQGIQSVQDLGKAFKGFFLVLKANPFALYLTAVTALVGIFVSLKDKVEIFGKAFAVVSNLVSSAVQFFKDLGDSMGFTSFKLDELKEKTKKYAIESERLAKHNEEVATKGLDREIKLRQAQGKQVFDLELKKQQVLRNSIDKQIKAQKNQGKDAGALIQASLDSHNQSELIKLNQQKYYADEAKKKKDLSTLKEKEALAASDAADILQGQVRADRRAKQSKEEKEALAASDAADILRGKINQEHRDKDLQAAKDLAAAKISIEQSSFSAISSLGTIFINDSKKLEKFNKAQALIQLGIDTAKAIGSLTAASSANPANAVTFGAAGIAQFAVGLATILANIAKAKQILSSPSSSSAPSLGGGGSASSGATPNIRTVGNIQTQLPSGQIENSNTGQTLKAYVVETEISDAQKRVNSIKNKSTFP